MADFDDSKDYPLPPSVAHLPRDLAISSIVGSVNYFANKQAYASQPREQRTADGLEEFSDLVYQFARKKGFTKSEAQDVCKNVLKKCDAMDSATLNPEGTAAEKSTKTPKKRAPSHATAATSTSNPPALPPSSPPLAAAKKSNSFADGFPADSVLSSFRPTPPIARQSESLRSKLPPALPELQKPLASSHKKSKRRNRNDEHEDQPKKKRHKKTDATARRSNAGKVPLQSSEQLEVTLNDTAEAGRRSRSTSLGSLGPSERSSLVQDTAKPARETSRKPKGMKRRSEVALEANSVSDDDVEREKRRPVEKRQNAFATDHPELETNMDPLVDDEEFQDFNQADAPLVADVEMRSPSPWDEEGDDRPTFVVDMSDAVPASGGAERSEDADEKPFRVSVDAVESSFKDRDGLQPDEDGYAQDGNRNTDPEVNSILPVESAPKKRRSKKRKSSSGEGDAQMANKNRDPELEPKAQSLSNKREGKKAKNKSKRERRASLSSQRVSPVQDSPGTKIPASVKMSDSVIKHKNLKEASNTAAHDPDPSELFKGPKHNAKRARKAARKAEKARARAAMEVQGKNRDQQSDQKAESPDLAPDFENFGEQHARDAAGWRASSDVQQPGSKKEKKQATGDSRAHMLTDSKALESSEQEPPKGPLAKLENPSGAMDGQQQQLLEKIAALEAKQDELTQAISSNEELLRARNSEIEELRAANKELKRIDSLRKTTLSTKTKEAEALRANEAKAEHAALLSETSLAQKDAEIGQLKADVEKLTKKVRNGELALSAKNDEIEELHADCEKLERTIQVNKVALAENDDRFAELEGQLGLAAKRQLSPQHASVEPLEPVDLQPDEEPSQQPSPSESPDESWEGEATPVPPKPNVPGKLSRPSSNNNKSAQRSIPSSTPDLFAGLSSASRHKRMKSDDWEVPETPSAVGRPVQAVESPELGTVANAVKQSAVKCGEMRRLPSPIQETGSSACLLPPVELSHSNKSHAEVVTRRGTSDSRNEDSGKGTSITSSPLHTSPRVLVASSLQGGIDRVESSYEKSNDATRPTKTARPQQNARELSDDSSGSEGSDNGESEDEELDDESGHPASPGSAEIQMMIDSQLGSDILQSTGSQSQGANVKNLKKGSTKVTDKKTGVSSPHFQEVKKRQPGRSLSIIPFPSTDADRFGLIQEELAGEPFKLIVAVIFLNQTRGASAIPVFRTFIERYPSAEALASGDSEEITTMLRPLGLQNARAETLVKLAQVWLERPPAKGKRFKTQNYPARKDSAQIGKAEVLGDDDPRVGAFEIGHLPGVGPYGYDSWRIFCRDALRGVADGWHGEGAAEDFTPEWMRVLPKDKELRAFLRWMWLKEGFVWDPATGEKVVPEAGVLERAAEGGKRVRNTKAGQGLRSKGARDAAKHVGRALDGVEDVDMADVDASGPAGPARLATPSPARAGGRRKRHGSGGEAHSENGAAQSAGSDASDASDAADGGVGSPNMRKRIWSSGKKTVARKSFSE